LPRPDRVLIDGLRNRARGAARGAARGLGALAALAWPPRARHAAAALAAAVAVLGLGGIGFQGGLASRLPSDLDWRSAAVVLARDARPGDAVALSPRWAERARLVLPPRLPVLSLPRYAGEDLLGVRRVWLLALPEAPGASAEAARELAARAAGGEPPWRLGALELSRYDLAAPALPLDFLPDRLALARVSSGGEPCAPAGPLAFACGPARVAREVREVEGAPRPCISVLTGPAGPVEVELPGVPLARVLLAHAGLAGRSAREPGAPVRVALRVGIDEQALELSGPGWVRLELETARDAGGPRAVALVASSPGAGREVCVDAASLP
jgi:hypothetical protein